VNIFGLDASVFAGGEVDKQLLLLWHLLVTPTPDFWARGGVTGALHASLHQIRGHRLQVVCPADARERVDHSRRWVQRPAQLAGAIVIGENVVVVVPPLAQRGQRHEGVLGRINVSENTQDKVDY